jgi:uncharacterized OB-fold protein
MSENSRPVPDVTPETKPYWEGAADGRLLLRECLDCGLTYHYPRALCPDCFSDDVEWTEAMGTGNVYSYSVSESMEGWPESDLPIVVAYVELDEGPRVLTNIDASPQNVTIGSRVEVRFADVAEDIAVPVFELVDD